MNRRDFIRVMSLGKVYARMLYDHKTDLQENVNIAELPENKKLVARLSNMLHKGWKAARP